MNYKVLLSLSILSCTVTFADNNLANPATNSTSNTDQVDYVAASKGAVKKFGKALKGELKKAIKGGGFTNGIDICSKKAIVIAETVSKAERLTIGRVSLKNRNSNNAPNNWQKEVLKGFAAKHAAGDNIKTMAYSKMVEENGVKQFRFMKAIPTGKLCLSCHGSKISPNVEKKLAELYPNDIARGYKEGDIRGAFVVIKNLGSAQ